MPRIRTIKPEFWTDEKTGTLPDSAKCFFIGLLNHCDDYGVIEWAPDELRVKIFPYHYGSTTGVLGDWLCNFLAPRRLVEMFSRAEDDGSQVKVYLFIPKFAKHQVINKPSKPILPGWLKNDTPKTYAERCGNDFSALTINEENGRLQQIREHYGSTTGVLLPGRERNGRERNGRETISIEVDNSLVAPVPHQNFSSSESNPASPEPDPEPAILEFPTKGNPSLWALRQSIIDEWARLYPGLDVLGQCRAALAWILAVPERRKTARGMKRFLVGWFGRANDSGHVGTVSRMMQTRIPIPVQRLE